MIFSSCGTNGSSSSQKSEKSISGEYVSVPRDVSLEMLNAEYWIEKADSDGETAESILMDHEEIEAFNNNNSCLITTAQGEELFLEDIGDELDGGFAADLIGTARIPKHPESYYLDGIATDSTYWEGLYALEDIGSIPETINVRFGFSVAWSTLRSFPTRDKLVKNDDQMFDEMLTSDFRPYEPLAVIHESADKNWYYCIMNGCGGWIEKEYTALCEDRNEWVSRQEMQDFLVVTGERITLSEDPYDETVSGLSLPMGTRLELVKTEDAPKSINGRIGYGCYTVKLPVRGEAGYIEDRYAYIPASEDVNEGYLGFTREEVIKQAFKYLGSVYGWGGDLHSVDCSGLVRSVYSCFGFRFPKTTAAQEQMSGPEHSDLTGKTDQEKEKVLKSVPMGSLVFFNGHVMILLGEQNGDLYVISSASLFGNDDSGADDVNTVTVNSIDSSYRADGTLWLDNVTSVITFK